MCGNDILSTVFYVSAITIVFAGVWAPLVLLAVGAMLFLYKAVYTEIVEALPVNGGVYNCLLNATSKAVAGVAGIVIFFSYLATAVISAKVGVEYLSSLYSLPIVPTAIVLLFIFALLLNLGLRDSARLAGGIFIFHLITLTVFIALGFLYWWQGHSFLSANLSYTADIIANRGGLAAAFFLAFAASLVGLSGFESSANFVEEQRPGVFRKTLRNMLWGVLIFSPLAALVVLGSLPYESIVAGNDSLLAAAARAIGGEWFHYWLALDAFLVLSGAVLTAYVGVSGLVARLSSDGCLPVWLARPNSQGAQPRIIFVFFLLTSGILILTGGDLLTLAGVYAIAFLSVMSLYVLGNLILKQSRPELPRTYRAPVGFVFLALLATLLGLVGNIFIDKNHLLFFAAYFLPAAALVLAMVYQDRLVGSLLRFFRPWPYLNDYLTRRFSDLTAGRLVAFIRHTSRLYAILDYINRNETGRRITLVHCDNRTNSKQKYQAIKDCLPKLKQAGVFPYLDITLIHKNMPFGPAAVSEVARELRLKKNRIFIGSIHHWHDFSYNDLGGVRIIF